MAKQAVGLGTVANDGLGDDLRTGGGKINANFDEIYTAFGDGSTLASYRTSTILASTSNAEGAALIGVEDAGTYFAGATVEAVLAEIGALLPAEANADVTDETNVLAALSGATLTEVDPAATDKVLVLDASDSFNIKNITWSDVTGLSGTPEGTAILSTGETGAVKFLREDGDGTCSWQVPAGSGDVAKVGTPADNQIGVWTGDGTIEGTSGLTYTGSVLEFTGGLLLNERADHAATPGAGKAELWVSNAATQKVYLTDDSGTDREVAFVTGGTDLSAYNGVFGLNTGTAVDVNTKALLEARISDVTDFAMADGDVYSGIHDFGGATSLEIPNGATPTVDAAGEIAIDTTVADWSHGILEYFSGEVMAVVAMPIAQLTTPTNGAVPTYNATNDEFELAVPAGSGDVSKVGTPVDGQIGVWTGDGTIEGDASLTFDTTDDTLVIAASGKLGFGAVDILSDSAGTTTLQNIDALDATTEATIEAAIDALTSVNLTTPTITTSFTFDGVTFTGATGADVSVVSGTAGTNGNLAMWNADGDAVDSTVVAANVLVDGDVGVSVQAYDADTLKADTTDNLTVGFTSSVDDDGTQSTGTYTPDPATGNYKQITNGGAFTLAPPSPANDVAVSVSVLIINNGSAGAITTSGFTHVGPGDSFTTTDTHKFLCRIDVYDDGGTEYSVLQVVALQ